MSDAHDVKSSWSVGNHFGADLVHHVTMCAPASRPCNTQCPWLVANHGTTVHLVYDHEVPGIPMPEQGFTFAPWKRAQVWDADLKQGVHGYGSLCHVRLAGTQCDADNAWTVVSRQCSGALVMQQREVLRFVEGGESALTVQGVSRVAGEMLGRIVTEEEVSQLDISELIAHAHASLLDPAIGSDAVAPALSPREIEGWGRLRDSVGRAREVAG